MPPGGYGQKPNQTEAFTKTVLKTLAEKEIGSSVNDQISPKSNHLSEKVVVLPNSPTKPQIYPLQNQPKKNLNPVPKVEELARPPVKSIPQNFNPEAKNNTPQDVKLDPKKAVKQVNDSEFQSNIVQPEPLKAPSHIPKPSLSAIDPAQQLIMEPKVSSAVLSEPVAESTGTSALKASFTNENPHLVKQTASTAELIANLTRQTPQKSSSYFLDDPAPPKIGEEKTFSKIKVNFLGGLKAKPTVMTLEGAQESAQSSIQQPIAQHEAQKDSIQIEQPQVPTYVF